MYNPARYPKSSLVDAMSFTSKRKQWLLRIVVVGLLLSITAGCADLALQPSNVVVAVVTPTRRPTVTPLSPDTPAPTFTAEPTLIPTATPMPLPTLTTNWASRS
jgi:hypothetical protein